MTLDDMTTHAASPPPNDIESLHDGSRRHGCSTRLIFRRLQAGQLARYKVPGDLRTFVSASELDALMAPHAVD